MSRIIISLAVICGTFLAVSAIKLPDLDKPAFVAMVDNLRNLTVEEQQKLLEDNRPIIMETLQELQNSTDFNATALEAALVGSKGHREARNFGFGGGFGGGFASNPLLLALLLKDRHEIPYWAMNQNQNTGGQSGSDLATLATLALLGLALISRLPTQG